MSLTQKNPGNNKVNSLRHGDLIFKDDIQLIQWKNNLNTFNLYQSLFFGQYFA